MKKESLYNGALTREQFLFREMRITAGLLAAGYTEEAAVQRIAEENLFQYPTERMLKNMAHVCMRRLRALDDADLVAAIASRTSEEARQLCLYAMIRQSRLVRDFMVTVIGRKYNMQDFHISRTDILDFLFQLQEQDDGAAAWSPSTVAKIRQVLARILVETGYLSDIKSTALQPVLLFPRLETVIRQRGETGILPAFCCLD